jgi:two-component system LytT family response regulator
MWLLMPAALAISFIYRSAASSRAFDPRRFAQVHRAHVVNLDHMRAFKRDTRGNLEAELTDGTRVPVSRARAQELRSLVR